MFLADHGFNVVRLYVAWPGVEPQRDQYNMTYLNVSMLLYLIHIHNRIDTSVSAKLATIIKNC